MKKALTLIFILVALATQAQTVTQESLQGAWGLVYAEFKGITVDLEKKTYTLSQELRDAYKDDPENLGAIEEPVAAMAAGNLKMLMVFDNAQLIASYTDNSGTTVEKGIYTISPGNPCILNASSEEGANRTSEISFTDGKLRLVHTDSQNTFIYSKIN